MVQAAFVFQGDFVPASRQNCEVKVKFMQGTYLNADVVCILQYEINIMMH